MLSKAEYIWIDGAQPTQGLRSKTRIVKLNSPTPQPSDFPEWSFDGSSTNQAEGRSSDLLLKPVKVVPDPVRGDSSYLVLCEVYLDENTPHESNSRSKLRAVLDAGASKEDPWLGFEQEYTLFQNGRPVGWPETGFPAPQGPFYCGVGPEQVYGRDLVEHHMEACMDAGLMLYGVNAEVMPAQWEFQVGYRGLEGESADPLNVADHNWLARYLLFRIGEEYNIEPSLANKPVKGDWNGAGQHTNFSTKTMRDKNQGRQAIADAIAALEKHHDAHIKVYGDKLEERLTGAHETCHITQFRSGNSDRGASIRIPIAVTMQGYGYIEDRRPGANADPYVVAARLLQTICAGSLTGDAAKAPALV